jgi:hypothetical protein
MSRDEWGHPTTSAGSQENELPVLPDAAPADPMALTAESPARSICAIDSFNAKGSTMRSLSLSLLLAVAPLTGCLATAVGVAKTENPNVKIELLFTHEGCRIFRFHDGALPIYYADCRGPAASSATASWRAPCGKGCSRPMMLTTLGGVEPAATASPPAPVRAPPPPAPAE